MILAQLENLEGDLDLLVCLTANGGGREELDYAVGVLLMAFEIWRRASGFLSEHSAMRSVYDQDGVQADEKTREYLSVLEVRLDDAQRRMDVWEGAVVLTERGLVDDDWEDEETGERGSAPVRLKATGSGPL